MSQNDSAAVLSGGAGRGSPFVGVMIFLAVGIFVGAMALIYYRWLSTPEPTAGLVVTGALVPDGSRVSVSGPTLGTPLTVVVSAENKHGARFFLQPGCYTFRVSGPGGRSVAEKTVTVVAGQMLRAEVSSMPATGPAGGRGWE